MTYEKVNSKIKLDLGITYDALPPPNLLYSVI